MTKMEMILERCTETIDAISKKEIPKAVWHTCAGIAVINITEVGFVFSVADGDGVLVKRNKKNNTWGPPSALMFTGVSGGAVFGKGNKKLVLFPMTEYAFSQLSANNKYELGGQVGLAVGPIGRELSVGADAGGHGATLTLSYLMEDGAFLNVGINNNFISAVPEENLAFYGSNFSVDAIVDGKVKEPSSKALTAFHDKLTELSKK